MLLPDKKFVRDEMTVHITLNKEELEKLATIAQTNVNSLTADDVTSTLHEIVQQVQQMEKPELSVSREEVIEWAKGQISDLTYGTMQIELESASYDDFLSSETVLKAFQEYKDSSKDVDFKTFLLDKVEYDWGFIALYDEENRLFKELSNRADYHSVELGNLNFRKVFNQICDEIDTISEALEEFGFEGSFIDLNSYLKKDYRINLMFATEQEKIST